MLELFQRSPGAPFQTFSYGTSKKTRWFTSCQYLEFIWTRLRMEWVHGNMHDKADEEKKLACACTNDSFLEYLTSTFRMKLCQCMHSSVEWSFKYQSNFHLWINAEKILALCQGILIDQSWSMIFLQLSLCWGLAKLDYCLNFPFIIELCIEELELLFTYTWICKVNLHSSFDLPSISQWLTF